MSPQLGFQPDEILEGNYKNIPETIATIKNGKIKGIIVDGNLHQDYLYKIVIGLRQARIVHTDKFPFIILGGTKSIEKTKTVPSIEELKKEFTKAA
jgi:hypothetical protein